MGIRAELTAAGETLEECQFLTAVKTPHRAYIVALTRMLKSTLTSFFG
jgi:hypothetical protein